MILFTLLLGIAAAVAFVYFEALRPNVFFDAEKQYLYIPTGSKFEDVANLLETEHLIKDKKTFEWLARQVGYDKKVRAGRYRLKKRMNNKDLILLLRSGRQEPVKLVINGLLSKENFAGLVARNLEIDSLELLETLNSDRQMDAYGLNKATGISLIIPNTYEFYWNTNLEKFLERMYKEHQAFWNSKREQKCLSIGFTKAEVATLASIVDKETNRPSEMETIAGVYINRLNKGMKLQADPTVIFALGDPSIRRVQGYMLSYDSPYNTYMYEGLPPGPICLPSVQAIEAVLDYKKHKYLFFCAAEDFSGYHNFAETAAEHYVNARKYQAALNRQGIK